MSVLPLQGYIVLTRFNSVPCCLSGCRAMALLLEGGDVNSAAILTPYNGQLRLLRDLLRCAQLLKRQHTFVKLGVCGWSA
jgi:hypothetical protein